MYVDFVKMKNFRTFRNAKITFMHPDKDFSALKMPKPKFPNVNLLLGGNGFGKTTLLKAVALTALGPAVGDSGIFPYRLIRREPRTARKPQPSEAVLEAEFIPHEQDIAGGINRMQSHVTVGRRGDLETLRWTHHEEKRWSPIFSAESESFFFVGYGASRRVEKKDQVDLGSRKASSFSRAQRVQGLFQDAYSLVPLSAWLQRENKGRYVQVRNLINRLLEGSHYEFDGSIEDGEYLFEREGQKIPFPALSDGYRAFLGWVGDLLYHVCKTCPSGKKLVDNKGIVMIDEIDLHLHPEWQMTILPTLAMVLPKIQFIVTSHSPLLVGSLEWMNIILMAPGSHQSTEAKRVEFAVHGLDADQVLLTEFFGLESTRAPGRQRLLKELTLKARHGDKSAAKQLLDTMSQGMEATE